MAISQIQSASLASGVPASSNMPTGSVLQVVQGSTTTEQSTSSTSFVDTNITATITPKFATSKILAIGCIASCAKNGSTDLYLQLVRNGSFVGIFGAGWVGYTASTAYNGVGNADICYLDSPATTSALTYKIQIKSEATGTVWINGSNTFSSITLLEIAG